MRKQEQLIVSEKTYHVKQLPALTSVKVQVQLMALYDGLKDKESVSLDDIDSLIKLLSKVDDDKLISLIRLLLDKNDCLTDENHKQIDVNEEFADNLFGLYELFVKSLLVNYKDFFLQLVSGKMGTVMGEITEYMKP